MPVPLRQRLLAPARFLGDELEHAAHAGRIEAATAAATASSRTAAVRRRIDDRRVRQQLEPELQRILAGGDAPARR